MPPAQLGQLRTLVQPVSLALRVRPVQVLQEPLGTQVQLVPQVKPVSALPAKRVQPGQQARLRTQVRRVLPVRLAKPALELLELQVKRVPQVRLAKPASQAQLEQLRTRALPVLRARRAQPVQLARLVREPQALPGKLVLPVKLVLAQQAPRVRRVLLALQEPPQTRAQLVLLAPLVQLVPLAQVRQAPRVTRVPPVKLAWVLRVQLETRAPQERRATPELLAIRERRVKQALPVRV